MAKQLVKATSNQTLYPSPNLFVSLQHKIMVLVGFHDKNRSFYHKQPKNLPAIPAL